MITYFGDAEAITEEGFLSMMPNEIHRFDKGMIESIHWLDADEKPDDDMICIAGGLQCSCRTGKRSLLQRWFGHNERCAWYVKLK